MLKLMTKIEINSLNLIRNKNFYRDIEYPKQNKLTKIFIILTKSEFAQSYTAIRSLSIMNHINYQIQERLKPTNVKEYHKSAISESYPSASSATRKTYPPYSNDREAPVPHPLS